MALNAIAQNLDADLANWVKLNWIEPDNLEFKRFLAKGMSTEMNVFVKGK